MIKFIDYDYKQSIRFNISGMDCNECLMTLFYEMDLTLNKFIIQYYSNLHMGSRININNQLHIPIVDLSKSFNISIQSNLDIIKVFIDRRLVYEKERTRRKNILLLVGRPFFGKTLKTFSQFFKQSSMKYIEKMSFLKLRNSNQKENLLYGRSSLVESFEVRNSSHNLLNPLDKAKDFDLEILNNYGEFHKITNSKFIAYLTSRLSSEISELISDKVGVKDCKYINLMRNKFLLNQLTLVESENFLSNLYLNSEVYDVEVDLILNICLCLISKKNDSKIALLILSNIYLNNKDYGSMVRLLRKIDNKPFDIDLVENYFIFLYSISINQQSEYFSDQVYELISKLPSNNVIYFGVLTSMLDILYKSYHYSKRGHQYQNSINKLLLMVKNLDEFNEIDYKNFSIGILNLMAQRPKTASEFFSNAMKLNHECSYYLIEAYEYSGQISKARELLLANIRSTNRFNVDDPLVVHYTTIDNWNIKEKRIRYIFEGEDNSPPHFNSLKTHEGLNFESIQNVYLADHNFKIGINFSKKIKDGLIFQYSNSITLYSNDKNITLKVEINGQTLILNIDNIVLNKINYVEISRSFESLLLKFNSREREINLSKNTIIYGGRLVFDKSSCNVLGYYVDIFKYPKMNKSNNLVIYSSWYGDEFTELFFNSLTPSLSRPDGLPSLLENYHIEWMIYTTKEQKDKIIKQTSRISNLFNKIEINTCILKSENFNPREYLHETFIDCVKKSIPKNAIILFAPPDHIFGSGLRNLIENIEADSYIISPHPRISYEKTYTSGGYKELIYNNKNDGVEGYITNTELASRAIHKYSHQIVDYGISPKSVDGILETSYWWSAVIKSNKLFVKFKEPPPVLLYARGDIISGMLSEGYSSTFERVDHDLVEWMYKTNRLKIIKNNADFFWVEYCKNGRNIPTLMNGYWPESAQNNLLSEYEWDI